MVQYTAGQRIRGSEINALPQLYYVTTDIVKNNSTVLTNVTGLAFPAEVNARYLVELFLAVQSDATRSVKFAWTYPAGATAWFGADGVAWGEGSSVGKVNRQSLNQVGIHAFSGENGAGIDVFIKPTAMFITPNAGTVQLQWAQQVAGAFNSTIRNGSCMRVSRML
jgi:hypothetical protein